MNPTTRTLSATAALMLAGALSLPVSAQQSEKVATVNGREIPKARVDFMVRESTAKGGADSPQLREQIKNDLINREVVVQEAERRGVAKNADVLQQVELARQQVILRAYLQDWSRSNPVTDDALKSEYERLKGQMGGNEYKAQHILLASEAEAKDVLARLKKGEKFDELAKLSKDEGSKANGGDLGWSTPATYVKPFADALGKLKKGETTEQPVQSQFGWHVIRLDDQRAAKHPPFDEVKQQMQQRVQQLQLDKLLADLRAKAKIQ